MNIIVFKKGQTKIEMTGEGLNSLDRTFEELQEIAVYYIYNSLADA